MLNVVMLYSLQCGCQKRKEIWSKLDEGTDLSGHACEGNRGDEEVLGRLRREMQKGKMVMSFAKMTVVNVYFEKREEHKVT